MVVYVKVNWHPLTCVWDQFGTKLTPTLFAGLPCARNRSLDWDLFCWGSSARLPSTSHAHKMDSRPGIIIYATSHYKQYRKKDAGIKMIYFWFCKCWCNSCIEVRGVQSETVIIVGNKLCDSSSNSGWSCFTLHKYTWERYISISSSSGFR